MEKIKLSQKHKKEIVKQYPKAETLIAENFSDLSFINYLPARYALIKQYNVSPI